jgi:acyl carrier protein
MSSSLHGTVLGTGTLESSVMSVLATLSAFRGPIERSMRLREDLAIDSLQTVEVLGMVERELGLRLAPGAERGFASVETVAELIAAFERALAGSVPTPALSCTT